MKNSFLSVIAAFAIILTGCGNGETTQETVPEQEAENEFVSIFNGQDLSGWVGDERIWSVENGAIIGETSEDNPTESNTFLIWDGGEPSDFELRFEYRFIIVSDDEYGNSGIQIRSEQFTDEDNPDLIYRVRGYQPDFAISDWIPGIHYEEDGRGILARRGQSVLIDADGESQEERFAEEDELGEYINIHSDWNDYRVYANEDTIRTYINNQLMHELIDQSPEAQHEGILAFQVHSGPPMRVELRNVELKELN
ncbi:DUF1080 domain-containing protein [soil metagenome]